MLQIKREWIKQASLLMINLNQFTRNFLFNTRSFEMKKSKIGIPRVSFYNDKENSLNEIRSKSTRDRYDNDLIT